MNSSASFFTDGAAYDQLMGRWSLRVADPFLKWLNLPAGLRWLDIGCGTGVFTAEIVKRCAPAAIIGVDPSPEQIAFARGRNGAEMAEFRVGDAQRLKFEDGSFDVAAMALVIHFVPEPPLAVAEMARVLRPGGWAVSYVWDYSVGGSPTAPVVAALRSIGFDPPSPPSAKVTSESGLVDLWRSAGVGGIDTRTITIPVEFPRFDDFWRSMTAPAGPVAKTIRSMPQDAVERLRTVLRERLQPRSGGPVTYEARANAIRGRVPP